MFLWAMAVWVIGLATVVPFASYYLLFHAPRDEYAVFITLVLFWVFGYWGIAGPLLAIVKVRVVFRRIEKAQSHAELIAVLRSGEAEDVVIATLAAEYRIPRFMAAKVYRLLAAKLTAAQSPPPGSSR